MLAQAGEREEKSAVHEDVTEGPRASTTIFVRLRSTISHGVSSKSTKPNPHPTIQSKVLMILSFDGLSWRRRPSRLPEHSVDVPFWCKNVHELAREAGGMYGEHTVSVGMGVDMRYIHLQAYASPARCVR